MEAGHTECAQVICDILKRKGSYNAVVNGVVSLTEGQDGCAFFLPTHSVKALAIE